MNKYLKHYGILGMKWGVRRSEAQLARARGQIDSASSIVKEAKNIENTTGNIRSAAKSVNLKNMSDAELREKVNRLNMEQQYNTLTSSQKTKGQIYTRSTLELAGSALAITSSALAIAISIKQLKSK